MSARSQKELDRNLGCESFITRSPFQNKIRINIGVNCRRRYHCGSKSLAEAVEEAPRRKMNSQVLPKRPR